MSKFFLLLPLGCLAMVLASGAGVRAQVTAEVPPQAVATYNCLGLYWKPEGGSSQRADHYVTQAGGPVTPRDGTNWDKAYPATSLGALLNSIPDGDTVYLGGSESATAPNYESFQVTITASGSPNGRKQLIGYDRGFGLPKLVGAGNKSSTGIFINTGVGYWTLKDLKFENRSTGINVQDTGHPGLIFEGILMWNVRKGFAFRDCDNLLVQNCRVDLYNEKGFWCSDSCDGVAFKNCVADCTGTGDVYDPTHAQWCTDPVGFDFHRKDSVLPWNTGILLEDCEALNNEEATTSYTQGDGIKFEHDNIGITLERCITRNNRDAGMDLKGTNQILRNCASINNRFGFKIWYDGELTNCIAVDNTQRQYHMPATSTPFTVTANYCTAYSVSQVPGEPQISAAVENTANTLVMNNCIFAFSGTADTYTNAGVQWSNNNTVRLANTANTVNAPMFVNPVIPWNGRGNNFDNQTYGASKGYNSQAMVIGDVISMNPSDPSGANNLAATDEVGAILALNWNNSTTANSTYFNVKNHTGSATTADIAFSNTTYGYVNDTPALAAPMADDAKMMRSQRGTTTAATNSITVTQVPYAKYDVYVYWGGRTSLEAIPATMTVEFQLDSGGTYVTNQTKYIKDDNHVWDGDYDESTATSAAAAVDGNEYVVFRNVTTPAFRLVSTCGIRTGISGFQIVERP